VKGATGATGADGTTGQDIQNAYGTGAIVITPVTGFTLVPGLSVNVTVPSDARVLVTTTGGIQCTSNLAAGFSTVDVWIFVDGVALNNGSLPRLIAANTTGIINMFAYWSTTTSPPLAPGPHVIEIRARGLGGANANAIVSGDSTSVLQGELDVTIIRQ